MEASAAVSGEVSVPAGAKAFGVSAVLGATGAAPRSATPTGKPPVRSNRERAASNFSFLVVEPPTFEASRRLGACA
jgi:hypothetical protein